jgi:hypothetical protein
MPADLANQPRSLSLLAAGALVLGGSVRQLLDM